MKKSQLILFFVFIIGTILFLYYQSSEDKRKASLGLKFCIGRIIDSTKVGRGSEYIDFVYLVKGKKYKSSIPIQFCYKNWALGCHIGDTVYVKYAIVDPNICQVYHELPKGVKLDDTTGLKW